MSEFTVRELTQILSALPEKDQDKKVAMGIDGVFETVGFVSNTQDYTYVWFFSEDGK